MTQEEQLHRAFDVGEKPRLSVSNVRGSITVRGEERDDIQVKAIKRQEGRGDPERTEIRMRQRGDRVGVKTQPRKDGDWFGWLRGERICAVDYTVQVPTNCDVDVNQVKGTIHVSGVSGRVMVNAVQGAVEIHKIDGRTRVHAVSATVDGDEWRGRAQVNTVSGDLHIAGSQLSHVKANTVSGDLSLETTVDDGGHYDFHSVSGDVTLYLPPERGLQSRGTTLSGQLFCDLPHEFSQRGRGGWRATINGGGPPVRFHSVSGDLELLAVQSA